MTVALETDPTVTLFRSQVAMEIEHAGDGNDAVEAITRIFSAHQEAHHARETGLREEVRALSGELRTHSAMVAQVATAAGRDLAVGARQAAAAAGARRALAAAQELLDGWPEEDTSLSRAAAELRQVLADQDVPPVAARTEVIALVPDPRHSVGWFHAGGEADARALPFVGWALVANSAGRAGAPEGAFLMGGRIWPLSELERREWMLSHVE